MNGSDLLADTNILLYILQGNKTIGDLVKGYKIHISFISELELFSFKQISSSEEQAILYLLNYCSLIGWNEKIQKEAIFLRRKNRFKNS